MSVRDLMTPMPKDEIIGKLKVKGLNPGIVKLLKEDDKAFQVLLKFIGDTHITEALNSLYDYLQRFRD